LYPARFQEGAFAASLESLTCPSCNSIRRFRSSRRGDAYAHLLIDYGPEYNLLWVCFLDDSGECWTYDNTQIRAQKNVTMGRTFVSRHQPKATSVAAE
jgi:hypothetical protein